MPEHLKIINYKLIEKCQVKINIQQQYTLKKQNFNTISNYSNLKLIQKLEE